MRRWLRLSCLAVSIASIAVMVFAGAAPAGAPVGVAPLEIVKTVSGPVPDGTTFTVALDCDQKAIVQGGGTTDGVTVTFGADGQPTSTSTFRFTKTAVSCDVTETVDGGAASTTYACESTLPSVSEGATAEQVAPENICEAAGPQADPIGVNVVTSSQTATVTVHNTFVAAPTTTTTTTKPQAPAASPAAVVAQPTFTG